MLCPGIFGIYRYGDSSLGFFITECAIHFNQSVLSRLMIGDSLLRRSLLPLTVVLCIFASIAFPSTCVQVEFKFPDFIGDIFTFCIAE